MAVCYFKFHCGKHQTSVQHNSCCVVILSEATIKDTTKDKSCSTWSPLMKNHIRAVSFTPPFRLTTQLYKLNLCNGKPPKVLQPFVTSELWAEGKQINVQLSEGLKQRRQWPRRLKRTRSLTEWTSHLQGISEVSAFDSHQGTPTILSCLLCRYPKLFLLSEV